jgi:hypothetical protein
LVPSEDPAPPRRLARLDPGEAAAYDRLVACLTPGIERALGPHVIANRARGRGVWEMASLEPWRPARAAWGAALGEALARSPDPAVLVADVRQCYASIEPDVLAARLRDLGGAPGVVAELRDLLERVGEDGVGGLPVGPAPSAILANAVLSVVDEHLRAAGILHFRWVDDIVAFAQGRRQALAGLDALRHGLDEVGLEPHPTKTALLLDPDAARVRLLTSTPSTGGCVSRAMMRRREDPLPRRPRAHHGLPPDGGVAAR